MNTRFVRLSGLLLATAAPLLVNAQPYPGKPIPKCELNAWFGILSPAGTPAAIVSRHNAEFVALGRAEVARRAESAKRTAMRVGCFLPCS